MCAVFLRRHSSSPSFSYACLNHDLFRVRWHDDDMLNTKNKLTNMYNATLQFNQVCYLFAPTLSLHFGVKILVNFMCDINFHKFGKQFI